MSYADDVMKHYASAPVAQREALAAALAAADKAMPAPKPTANAGDPLKSGAQAAEAPPETFADARPDVMLAKLANEIQLAEDVDYGTALQLAQERDPVLAFRYRDRDFLREHCKGAVVEPPRGLHMCEARPDVELAERARVRATQDGSSYAAAERLVLAENPKLKSRYHDFARRESALDALAYRAHTIRAASGMRVTQRKAVDAALAEDAMLRESVLAYFEPAPYKPTDYVEA